MFSSLLPLVRTVSRPCPPIVKHRALLQAAPSTEYNVTAAADGRRDAVTQETARRLHEKTNFREEFFGPEEQSYRTTGIPGLLQLLPLTL